MGENENSGNIPWELCPYRFRFEEQVKNMEQLLQKIEQVIGSKVDGVVEVIRQEMLHQREMTNQYLSVIRDDVNHVAAQMRDHENRIAMLERKPGLTALSWWKWLVGAVGVAFVGGVVGWLLQTMVGG